MIDRRNFSLFLGGVPHLFGEGGRVLEWIASLKRIHEEERTIPEEIRDSITRSAAVIRKITLTAGVTAPPALWILRQILSDFRKLGLLRILTEGKPFSAAGLASKEKLDPDRLLHDLRLLYVLGYLDRNGPVFYPSRAGGGILRRVREIAEPARIDATAELYDWFAGGTTSVRARRLQEWADMADIPGGRGGPIPGLREMELGFRVMPVVVALSALGQRLLIPEGHPFEVPHLLPEIQILLEEAGWVRNGRVTTLGAAVLGVGPGVFGIIGAYQPYLLHHTELLLDQGTEVPHVETGPNITASGSANQKTFRPAIRALKNYCDQTGAWFSVVIEHAVGLGLGIRAFRDVFGEAGYRFVAADSEEISLDAARLEQRKGALPAATVFLQNDIGDADGLIRFLREKRMKPEEAVMIVGNGFQEARRQTDYSMAALFRTLREAGITLLFIEESGLTDEMVWATGFYTNHSAFAWTQRTSGQTLRPPWRYDSPQRILSWSELLELAGYRILWEHSPGTRPIYPCPLPRDQNPPVSQTFLAVR